MTSLDLWIVTNIWTSSSLVYNPYRPTLIKLQHGLRLSAAISELLQEFICGFFTISQSRHNEAYKGGRALETFRLVSWPKCLTRLDTAGPNRAARYHALEVVGHYP